MTTSALLAFLSCLGLGQVGICHSARDPLHVPPLSQTPLHVTNYWVFDENGEYLPGYMGQCDSDCSATATGFVLEQEDRGQVEACISKWTRLYWTTALTFNGRTVACVDTFGDETYRAGPFWHEGWGSWVVAVDLFTDQPTYELVYNWEKEVVRAP